MPVLVPALVAVLALVTSACGNSDSELVIPATPDPPLIEPSDGSGQVDSELVIGSVLPETGGLEEVGKPIIAGVDLAVADVIAAGGRIRLLKGDSGTNPDIALEAVNDLLDEGAQVIVGAAASGVSQGIIQTLYEARIPQCSPSNGDPAFSTQANAEYYFRTTASSMTEAPVMAASLHSREANLVALVARTDAYGSALADLLKNELGKLGVDSVIIPYPPDASDPDDLVEKVVASGADSVGLIAFDEGIPILRGLLENGFTGEQVHAGSGLLSDDLPKHFNPDDLKKLDGLRSHAGVASNDEFEQRVMEIVGEKAWGGGAAYDCVVLLSLAYLAAGTASGPELIEVVPGLTRYGRKCYSYAECAELLIDGVDIDYDGMSGPLEFTDGGDTTVMRLGINEVRNGAFQVVEEVEVVLPPVASEPSDTDLSEFLAAGPELTIGVVLPETGSLSYVFPPESTGAKLAVDDIRAAGGRVRVLSGDSGTDPDTAVETVNRLLGEGADVIFGAAASGVSQSFIQTLHETQVVQCAASNTSHKFSTQSNAEYFFRTVSSTEVDAPIMAGNIARKGGTSVAILARSDDWGQSLAEQMVKSLGEFNITSEVVPFSHEAPSFQDVALAASRTGADTVVVLAFAEGAQIVRSLLEEGVPPSAIHGGAGMYDLELPSRVSPGQPERLDGFTVYAASGGDDFNQRLSEFVGGNIVFGGQAYDCVIVLALATLAAGTTDGPELIAEVPGVTRDGQKCTSFADCAALLAAGVDIDYDGVSGPLELDDVGDTTVGRYAIAEVRGGVIEVVDIVDYP
ncbi:ABC transporter substrate-binding protein [Candidatus Poriferisocius sp.]|uniref:ABC transporter substrate-binding protein n=1 Tax=Candidatus Poriferisocius sp. TaxID=3101276 RepID=UPI003B019506